MWLSNVLPWKKICFLLCSSAFFWATSQSMSLAKNQLPSPPIKEEAPQLKEKRPQTSDDLLKEDGDIRTENDDAEGGDDDDMDEDKDDTPEESWNTKSQPQTQELSIFMSPEAYLETLNKAQTKGGSMNTQQVMMLSSPPSSKQDAAKEEPVRSNSIENSTDEDGRITTTYHSGFRPTLQTQPQYVDLGCNNRLNTPGRHPSKPLPPKPYLDGGESTAVGTDP